MNSKYKKAALLYFPAGACFLTAGIVGIRQIWNMPYMYIGFGCAFLCFGFANLSKGKKGKNSQSNSDKQ